MGAEYPSPSEPSKDYSDIFDITASTKTLNERLNQTRAEEREIFLFNTGPGVLINRLMPIPIIAAGLIYQFDPTLLNLELSGTIIPIMLFLILVGQVLWQVLLAKRARGLKLTRANFELEGVLARRNGQPFKSLEGYDQVSNTLRDEHYQAISHRVFGIIAILCYLITLFGAIFVSSPSAWNEMTFTTADPWPFLFAMSVAVGTGLSILVWLAATMDPTKDFDASQPTGLLATYVPSGHPTLLTAPFTQMMRYMMEPTLASKWNQYIRETTLQVKDGISKVAAVEKTIFLYHMNQEGVLDNGQVQSELGEIFSEDSVDQIISHEIFNMKMIQHLLELTREYIPSFFLVIDRLEHLFMNELEDLQNSTFIFDSEVDRQTSSDQINLLIYIACLIDSDETYEVEVISPSLEPQHQTIKLTFDKEQTVKTPESKALSISSNEKIDLIDVIGDSLDKGSVLWLSMQPNGKGIFDTHVRLKNSTGDVIEGRTMRTSVSKNISQTLKQYSGKAGKAGGLAVPLLKVVPSLRKLVGLP